jgi:hypothetical protein
MLNHVPKLGAALVLVIVVAWADVSVTSAFTNKAFVEQTGQTTSFADGDDGDIQAGVPFPTPRFTDRGDGTVKDNLTNLIWLKRADCLGFGNWQSALDDANKLANGGCGLTDGSQAGDWRLPNVKELQSLIDFGHFNPALSEGHPFSGVEARLYWSSTTVAHLPEDLAWLVSLYDGSPTVGFKGSPCLCPVWPVRGREWRR